MEPCSTFSHFDGVYFIPTKFIKFCNLASATTQAANRFRGIGVTVRVRDTRIMANTAIAIILRWPKAMTLSIKLRGHLEIKFVYAALLEKYLHKRCFRMEITLHDRI